ncbi:hypothetical protein WBG78_17340 [Chryseolinea sp. T2]|uniref:hypothetical protein n=1 Tax=Chryseolinea sp. T2 TaxID=3129255 RepID=UPI0030782FC2
MRTCASRKRVFDSAVQAEQALVDLQGSQKFQPGEGPVAIYRCDMCGGYHLTSKGPANPFLVSQQKSGAIDKQREANRWIEKFDRK